MQKTTYVRLYADDTGDSHLEDIVVGLEPVDFAPPAPPLNYLAFQQATAVAFLGGDPSWGGDVPHPTPRRQIMCTMSGRFRITASDGDQREFGPGQMLLLEDTQGKGHSTQILEECVVLVVRLE